MKTYRWKLLFNIAFFCLATIILAACESRQRKDEIVKADLVVKAKKQKAFTGVRFVVENGIVTLTGNCPTEKLKSKVESTVKGLYGVENVVNNISIGPVTVGTDDQLRESVDSVLTKYPAVAAIVIDSAVMLEGEVASAKAQALLSSIEQLKPKRIENKIMLQ